MHLIICIDSRIRPVFWRLMSRGINILMYFQKVQKIWRRMSNKKVWWMIWNKIILFEYISFGDCFFDVFILNRIFIRIIFNNLFLFINLFFLFIFMFVLFNLMRILFYMDIHRLLGFIPMIFLNFIQPIGERNITEILISKLRRFRLRCCFTFFNIIWI